MQDLRQMILENKAQITRHEVGEMVIYTKDMTVAENMAISKDLEKITMGELAIKVMITSFVDANGERLFTQADYDALMALPMDVFKSLQEVALSVFAGIKKSEAKKN